MKSLLQLAEQRYIEQNLQLPSVGGSSIVQVFRSVKEGHDHDNSLTNTKSSRRLVLLSDFCMGNYKLHNQQARWVQDPAAADAVHTPFAKAVGLVMK